MKTIQVKIDAEAMTTRTVQLTLIKSEVDGYRKYLHSEGLTVVSVVWPKVSGVNVAVTFEVN